MNDLFEEQQDQLQVYHQAKHLDQNLFIISLCGLKPQHCL